MRPQQLIHPRLNLRFASILSLDHTILPVDTFPVPIGWILNGRRDVHTMECQRLEGSLTKAMKSLCLKLMGNRWTSKKIYKRFTTLSPILSDRLSILVCPKRMAHFSFRNYLTLATHFTLNDMTC